MGAACGYLHAHACNLTLINFSAFFRHRFSFVKGALLIVFLVHRNFQKTDQSMSASLDTIPSISLPTPSGRRSDCFFGNLQVRIRTASTARVEWASTKIHTRLISCGHGLTTNEIDL